MPLDDLDALQRWTQDALLGAARGSAEVARRVKPSATLDAAARLDVYRRMIAIRFAGVVENDFPATRALLGAERFDAQVAAYVAARPSTSFTLDRFSADFPAQLREAGEDAAAELARYEATIDEARDALEEPPLKASAVAAVPPDAWPTRRLLLAAGFRLFDASYAVDAAYADWLADQRVRTPRAREEIYAVFRARGRTVRLRLGRRQRALVAVLADDAPLCTATAAARAEGLRAGEIEALFARLTAAGAFRAVR
jgi:hypothetical protein